MNHLSICTLTGSTPFNNLLCQSVDNNNLSLEKTITEEITNKMKKMKNIINHLSSVFCFIILISCGGNNENSIKSDLNSENTIVDLSNIVAKINSKISEFSIEEDGIFQYAKLSSETINISVELNDDEENIKEFALRMKESKCAIKGAENTMVKNGTGSKYKLTSNVLLQIGEESYKSTMYYNVNLNMFSGILKVILDGEPLYIEFKGKK